MHRLRSRDKFKSKEAYLTDYPSILPNWNGIVWLLISPRYDICVRVPITVHPKSIFLSCNFAYVCKICSHFLCFKSIISIDSETLSPLTLAYWKRLLKPPWCRSTKHTICSQNFLFQAIIDSKCLPCFLEDAYNAF